MPSKTSNTKKYTYALGRRRSAVATVKLYPGKLDSKVNNKPIKTYFKDKFDDTYYLKPFVTTSTQDKYYFESKIVGGGKVSQKEALVLAISRALKIINPEFGQLLRTAGLLTVDSRVRQRRQVGKGGKSRRQKQSPKR